MGKADNNSWRRAAVNEQVYNRSIMAIDTTQAIRIKTVVTQDGVLNLRGPFHAGDNIEVIILTIESDPPGDQRYLLQGTPYTFIDPIASVAEEDWAVLR